MTRFQIGVGLMLGGLAAAVILLGYSQYQTKAQLQMNLAAMTIPTMTAMTPSPLPTPAELVTFERQLEELRARLDKLELTPTTGVQRAVNPTPTFHRQVLTLGSWTTSNRNWAQTGLEISLNQADYPDFSRAYFEAGLSCGGCIAGARVTNKTTGAIINISEVYHDTSTVTWKRSAGFKLHPGNNIYVVELRSSSGEAVNLTSSRIVIE